MSLLKTNEIQNYNGSSLTLTASTVSTSAQLNTGGNVSVTGSLNVSDDSTTRTNLGLGSMATQNANAVAITGGTINTVQPAIGQSLTIKDEDGNTAITIGTDNTAAGYLSLNFGSYHGSSGGAGSGSLTANTLDDYEVGTWTPTVVVGGSSATLSSSSFGIYTIVGDLCHVQGRIEANSGNWGNTGGFVVGGLPFGVRVTNGFLNLPLISHFRSKLGLRILIATNAGTGGTVYIQPNSTGDTSQAQITGDVAHTGVLELNFSYRKV